MAVDLGVLQIIYYPDPVLLQVAKPVVEVTDEVCAVAQRMVQLMHEASGVGLAAPQMGLSWRMFVANPTQEHGQDRVYINPQLTAPAPQSEEAEEGCLSLPQIKAKIRRPRRITISAVGLDGQAFAESGDDLIARIWQHETDHLDGILILDRMPPIDKLANRAAIRQLEQAARGSRRRPAI